MASVESAAAAWITGLEARLLKIPTRAWACTLGCAGSFPDASKPYLQPTTLPLSLSLLDVHTMASRALQTLTTQAAALPELHPQHA